jgi:DNA-binding MarR family transcriptional regulator
VSVYTEAVVHLRTIEKAFETALEGTAAEGLSPVEVHVLAELFKRCPQKPSELALEVGRAATSFTPILDGLEKRGLIRRRASLSDRRAVSIFLTEEAQALREPVQLALVNVELRFAAVEPVVQ